MLRQATLGSKEQCMLHAKRRLCNCQRISRFEMSRCLATRFLKIPQGLREVVIDQAKRGHLIFSIKNMDKIQCYIGAKAPLSGKGEAGHEVCGAGDPCQKKMRAITSSACAAVKDPDTASIHIPSCASSICLEEFI